MSTEAPSKASVVIEIGSDWLKVIRAEPSRGGLSITGAHVERLDARVSAAAAISGAMKRLKVVSSPALVFASRQMVNVRLVELPSTNPDEIADMVDLQVGKQTPYSRDEIVFDYRIAPGARSGYTTAMLAIAQKGVMRQRFYALQEAGVTPARMSVSSEGLLNWYDAMAVSGETVALLDVDYSYSDFMVMAGHRPVFTRSILIGAGQLIESFDTAKERMATEVKRSLESCHAESPATTVTRILVTGAPAVVANLAEHLNSAAGIPAVARDSLQGLGRASGVPDLSSGEYGTVSLTPAVGMALAPQKVAYDLVPDSVKVVSELVQRARLLTTFGMLVMTALVAATAWGMAALYLKRDYFRALEAERMAAEPTIRKVRKMEDIIAVVDKRRRLDTAALNLLWELHGRVAPANVSLDAIEVNVEKGSLQVGGSAASRQDVTMLVNSLEQSPFFSNAKEGQSVNKDNRVKFQVTCNIERGK